MKQTTLKQTMIRIFLVAGSLLVMLLLGLHLIQEGPNGMEKALGWLLLACALVVLWALGRRGFRFFFSKPKK